MNLNLNKVDWESLEKKWRFIFGEGEYQKIYRKELRTAPKGTSEVLVILVSAYKKFEELILK